MEKHRQAKASEAGREGKAMSASEDIKKAGQANAPAVRPSPPKTGLSDADQAGVGNVEKIREILFGSQMREFEARLARLEHTLAESTAELRQNTLKRLETLENHFNKELETLDARLRAERQEREETAKRLAQEMKEADDTLARKIGVLTDQGITAQRELRGEILKQSKELRDEMAALQAEISAVLERRFQELAHAKTDRAALSAILTEMAMRLSEDLQLPLVEG